MKVTSFALDGLVTDPGPFSSAPDGALVEAQNVVCERQGLLEPRGPIALTTDPALANVNDLIHHGHQVEGLALYTWARNESTLAWTIRRAMSTTITGPSAFTKGRVRSDYVKGRLLFTSEDGVCEAPFSGTVATRAGLPQPSMPWGYVATGGAAGTWLATGQSVGYRFTLTRTRADGTTVESAPTAMFIVRNTSGSSGGVTFVPLPGLTYTPWDVGSTFDIIASAGDLLNVYRGPVLSSATGTPSDVMKLRASLPISAGVVQVFDDKLADSDWNGPLLYTQSSRDGALQARYRPSYARDICTYNGMTLYAGAESPHRLNVVCKAIGDISSDPQQAICSKTVTVTTAVSTALTAISASDIKYLSPGQWITLSSGSPGSADARFSVDTQIATVNYGAGTATLTKPALAAGATSVTVWDWIAVTSGASTFRMWAQEPSNTAIDDRRFLQGHPSTGVRMGGYQDAEFRWNNAATRIKDVLLRAFGSDEVYGLPEFRNVAMTFERASTIATPFTVRSSKPNAFNKQLDQTTGVASAQDGGDARIAVSTPDIPDACPIGQTLDIGDLSSPIYRIVPARSSVLVIKGDGIYLLYGSSPSTLSVTLLDGTVSPPRFDIASGWITKYGDTVYMMSSRGPVAITDAGVTPFGADIYESLREQWGPGFERVGSALACASGSAIATPTVMFAFYRTSVPAADVVYVYNVERDAWTTWRARRPCTALWTGSLGAQSFGFTVGRHGTYRDDRTSMGSPITATTEPLTGDTGETTTLSSVVNLGGGRFSFATTARLVVGDVLIQGAVLAVVEATPSGSTGEAVAVGGALTSGSASVIESYPIRVAWTARTLGDLGREKQYLTVGFAFALRSLLLRFKAYFQSAYAVGGALTVVEPTEREGWSDSSASYTSESLLAAPEIVTCAVPLDVTRDWGLRVGFTLQQAKSWFSLGGIVVEAEDGGPRVGRLVG